MAWKEHVNRTLTRTTGYMLTRSPSNATLRVEERLKRVERLVREQTTAVKAAGDAAGAAAKAAGAATTAAKAAEGAATTAARAATAAETAAKRVAPPKPAPKEFPADYDQDYRDIIDAVRPYTMTGSDKLHALITATRYIERFTIPGAIVECGVWRGGSMHAAARTLDRLGSYGRDFYLYDTFEGMTEPGERDLRHDGAPAAQMLAASDRSSRVWAVASLEDVQAGFATVPYPSERIRYVKGPIEETVPAQMPDEIAILRLDTDWYESTAHEFEHLYPRLVSGGVLMVDDYGFWKGSREATEEFIERTGERLMLVRMDSGRVAVKP